MIRLAAVFCVVALWSARAQAHKPSDSYLTVGADDAHTVHARWDIAVRDLDHALVLDRDGDGAVTWGEVRPRESAIVAYALARLTLSTEARACTPHPRAVETVEHSDGIYLSLPLSFECASAAQRLTVDYRLFAELDPLHRAVIRADGAGEGEVLVLAPGARGTLALAARISRGPSFLSFVAQGMHHIWGGLDHVLFLIALLLPSVLRREQGRWIPVPAIRSALGDVGKIVTAFTAAHSLTLSLATLGVVSVSSRLIEPAIAASVALAAANNVRPVFGPDRWVVAFALGLLHGFGFSSVLSDAGLAGRALARVLVGFNVGVEVGQLAIVAAFVPVAFFLRRTVSYRRLALVGGSVAITGVSVIWIVQRIATG